MDDTTSQHVILSHAKILFVQEAIVWVILGHVEIILGLEVVFGLEVTIWVILGQVEFVFNQEIICQVISS